MSEQLNTVLRLARQAGFQFHSGFLNGESRSLPLCLSELECFYHLVLENERKKGKPEFHECKLIAPHIAPHDGYGNAVEYCSESESGTLWVSNGEYSSQVNFCPVCGYKAKVAVK